VVYCDTKNNTEEDFHHGMEYSGFGAGVNQQVAIVDRSATLPLANHHSQCIMVSVEQRGVDVEAARYIL
jgi:hypothetical protein